MRCPAAACFCLGLPLLALAAEPFEYRYLDGFSDPRRWAPSECELAASPRTAWEHPALRMHIPVDFHAGEKAYPIGWPRMYLSLKPDEQGWQDFDRFEFQLFTESSRASLPKRPLVFHLYNAQGQSKLITLDQAAVGVCATFDINISDLGLSGPVVRIGASINESDYADKDVLDFHFGGFRLARSTVARVTELKAAAPALFRDSRVLPVELVVEGPSDKLAAGVLLQLRQGDRVAYAKTAPVARGRQTLYLPLAGAGLAPGDYALVACPDDPALKKETTVTITSSPWN